MPLGSWVGPVTVANEILSFLKAKEANGKFVIQGPDIEMFLSDREERPWDIVEIKPGTMCFVADQPVQIVTLLHTMEWHTTSGLPVASKK